jgi:hypothetical protein
MSLMDEKDNTLLERGADNDIVRLRWRLQIRENIIGRLVAENQRLRLRADEREAIGNMIHLIECQHEDYGKEAHTLRKLLARLS